MSITTQIAAIEAALDTGATSVTDENGRTANYGSRKDMLDALDRLKGQQEGAGGNRRFAITQFRCSGTQG